MTINQLAVYVSLREKNPLGGEGASCASVWNMRVAAVLIQPRTPADGARPVGRGQAGRC
jgi:hypothetical protein